MLHLDALADRIEQWSGISLDRGGRNASLERFVEVRLRELRLSGVTDYLGHLEKDGQEREGLLNAVTVNYSWFYRDAQQMRLLEQLLASGFPPGERLKIWVPGCANGEDAYCLGMLTLKVGRPALVLGTDVNSASLAAALEGKYGTWSLRELPPELRPFFDAPTGGLFRVADRVRERVLFEHHNLVDAPKLPSDRSGWDLILCRNVLIYFRRDAAEATHGRLGSSLSSRGWLALGASEVLQGAPPGLELAQLGDRLALRRAERSARLAFGAPRPVVVPVLSPALRAVAAPKPAPPAAPTVQPESPALATVRAATATIKASPATALAKLSEARQLDPLCVEAHFHLGMAFHLLGDPQAAVPPLRAALFLDPALWPAAFYLALSYENLGKPTEARAEYQRVLETHQRPIRLDVRGELEDLEAWKSDVLALVHRRAGRRSERRP